MIFSISSDIVPYRRIHFLQNQRKSSPKTKFSLFWHFFVIFRYRRISSHIVAFFLQNQRKSSPNTKFSLFLHFFGDFSISSDIVPYRRIHFLQNQRKSSPNTKFSLFWHFFVIFRYRRISSHIVGYRSISSHSFSSKSKKIIPED